jgi:hypothetical protein
MQRNLGAASVFSVANAKGPPRHQALTGAIDRINICGLSEKHTVRVKR